MSSLSCVGKSQERQLSGPEFWVDYYPPIDIPACLCRYPFGHTDSFPSENVGNDPFVPSTPVGGSGDPPEAKLRGIPDSQGWEPSLWRDLCLHEKNESGGSFSKTNMFALHQALSVWLWLVLTVWSQHAFGRRILCQTPCFLTDLFMPMQTPSQRTCAKPP